MYKFKTYDAESLRKCGEAFVADVASVYPGDKAEEPATEEWTEFVLDWFTHAAADGLLVDARKSDTRADWKPRWPSLDIPRRNCAGEFMVDLAHSTYPSYAISPFTPEYWHQALGQKRPLEIKLALESEWGEMDRRDATLCAVMADAIKIAGVQATVKVMVFGCQDEAHRDESERSATPG